MFLENGFEVLEIALTGDVREGRADGITLLILSFHQMKLSNINKLGTMSRQYWAIAKW